MTEAILASPRAFLDHLADKYSLQLSSELILDIKLLLQVDKPLLRQLLYRFENQTMKRKPSQSQQKAGESSSSFFRGIQEAAKKVKSGDAFKREEVESYEYSESSLDNVFLQVSTPNTSQVDFSLSQSSSGVEKISPPTTGPTSESSQDSVQSKLTSFTPALAVSEGYAQHRDLLRLLTFGVKYMMESMKHNGLVRDTVFSSPEDLRVLCNFSTKEAVEYWKESSHPDLKSAASLFVSPSFLEASNEVDREEQMLKAEVMYLHFEGEGSCSGRISLRIIISISQEGHIGVTMRPLCAKMSSRFTRRYGSSRCLSADVPKLHERDIRRKALEEFLSKPFFILDRRYDLLCIKEKDSRHCTAHFFEFGPDVPSIRHFLDWHGPWQDNVNGKLVKYLQRLHLGLSTTIPGVFIPRDKVRFVEDIISSTGKVMTDGAACISRGAMMRIASALGLTSLPSAVQGRYDGAKGMWYLAPYTTEESNDVWIEIRDSQRKLLRTDTTEICHQTLDVIRVSTATLPSSLSLQTLLVLSHNGVTHQILVKMQREQLQEIIVNLLGPEGKRKDGLELAKSLDEAGNVYITRARRNTPHLAAAKGLISRAAEDQGEKVTEEELEDGEVEASTAEYQTVFERAYDMLLAGFEVEKSRTLMELVVRAAKIILDRAVKDFRIVVTRSAEAFIIPDPIGVLKEGEIQFRFGHIDPIDPTTKLKVKALFGEVLVTRHPCLTPTDIRKVKATTYPELADYTDVIVFSTQGETPLASLLSGGDYDGDAVRVYWEPALVQAFHNADIERHQPSVSIADVFHEDVRTVDDFLKGSSRNDQNKCLADLLTAPLRSSGSKGIYGHLQKVAAYAKGCDSQEAIDLAFKFNNSMDGVKSGLTIKESVLQQDRKQFNLALPKWADKERKPSSLEVPSQYAPQDAVRNKKLGRCILDVLYESGNHTAGVLKGELEARQQQIWFKQDDDIASRWEEAVRLNTLSASQMEVMSEHCRSILAKHQKSRAQYAAKQEDKRSGSTSPTKRLLTRSPVKCESPKRCDSRQFIPCFSQFPLLYKDWIHDHVKAFEMAGLQPLNDSTIKLFDVLDAGQIQRLDDLLASCLYVHACKNRYSEKIAFDIAGPELINLKAVEKKRRLEQGLSTRYHQSIVALPRTSALALRLGKML